MGRQGNRFHAFQEKDVRQTSAKVTEKKNSETHARKNQQEGVKQNAPPLDGNKSNATIRKNVPNNAATKPDPKINVGGSIKVDGKGVQGMQERDAHAGHAVHVPPGAQQNNGKSSTVNKLSTLNGVGNLSPSRNK
ncbi:unnamed protein product [Linum trigynum]